MIKHRHHIIPRHVGGTDDPSNLVELTVEEHAREHYILWNQHGRWQDKVAWQALSGMVDKTEVIHRVLSESNKRSWKDPTYRKIRSEIISKRNKKLWTDPVYRKTQIENLLKMQSTGILAAQTKKARQKRKDTLKAIEHNKGSKNPMFGKMWITNGTDSHRINKNDSIPEGYRKGRVITPK